MQALEQHVHKVLRRSGLQPADCDDVAQETLLRLMKAQARGSRVSDPQAFTARVALRLVVDRWRQRAKENGHAQPLAAHQAALAGRHAEPHAPAEPPTEVRALYAALAQLPAKQRAVVTLRKLWELEYAAIANLLGLSIDNCRSHCRHGMQRLRRLLDATDESSAARGGAQGEQHHGHA